MQIKENSLDLKALLVVIILLWELKKKVLKIKIAKTKLSKHVKNDVYNERMRGSPFLV